LTTCKTIWLLIVTCVVQKIYAQNPVVNLLQFNSEDGLEATEVLALDEDDEGFLWLGTDHGLQRFDGSRLKIFLPDPADKNSIPSEKIWHVLAGRNNKIWATTQYAGLAVYDKKTSRFTSYQFKSTDSTTLASNELSALLEDENGLWVLSMNNCLNYLSYSTGKFQRFPFPKPHPALKGSFINLRSHLLQDCWNKNLIWISTNAGLYQFFKNRHEFRHYPLNRDKIFLYGENMITGLTQDNRGRIWCGLYYGLSVFDPLSVNWTHYPYYKMPLAPKDGIRYCRIHPKSDSLLTIVTWPFHWFEFNLNSKRWVEDSVNVNNKTYVAELNMLTSCRSHDGAVWIGGYYSINKENLHPLPFYTSMLKDATEKILSRINYPWSFFDLKKNNQFLMGSRRGDGLLYVENYQSGKSEVIHPTVPPDNNGDFINVNSIIAKNDSQWWLATLQGLFEYTAGNHFFSQAKNTETRKALFTEPIQTLFSDMDHGIWIGTPLSGLFYFNPKTNHRKHYSYNPVDSGSLGGNEAISDILRGPDGNLWIANLNCVNILDQRTGKFTHIDNSLTGMPQAEELRVSDMDMDASGRVWLGTRHGLVRITSNKNKSFSAKTYSIQHGLAGNQIHKVLVDKKGNIWLTTDNSLSYFNTETENFTNFGQRDGIAHISGSDLLEQLPDGNIIYGMWNSLLWFHPDSIINYRNLPLPYLFGLQINDAEYTEKNINAIDHLDLSYKQRNISFQLAGLGLSGNFRHYFAYRLAGYDDNWNYAGQRNYVNYTHLPAGKYVFQYKVANSMGQWNPVMKEIPINISPASWQTWWFIGLVVFIVAAVIYLFVRKRIVGIRRDAELKQKIAESEMMALRAQMNPHFIFNSLNSIDNLIQSEQKEKATVYLSKFAKLLRAILENSKQEVIPCWKDLETLQLYLELEKLRWDKIFTSEIAIDEKIFQGDYKVPPMVIQPFVENAIHHGLLNKTDSNRKLFISVAPENGHINYIIEDNGVGRTKAEEYKKLNHPAHQSVGMQITTQRINLFNQGKNGSIKITDLFNEQQQPAGTKVEIRLHNQS
jgi:ligand-binding sensor domain-containing protein